MERGGGKEKKGHFSFCVSLTLSYMNLVMIDVFPTAWSPKNTCFGFAGAGGRGVFRVEQGGEGGGRGRKTRCASLTFFFIAIVSSFFVSASRVLSLLPV